MYYNIVVDRYNGRTGNIYHSDELAEREVQETIKETLARVKNPSKEEIEKINEEIYRIKRKIIDEPI